MLYNLVNRDRVRLQVLLFARKPPPIASLIILREPLIEWVLVIEAPVGLMHVRLEAAIGQDSLDDRRSPGGRTVVITFRLHLDGRPLTRRLPPYPTQ